MARTDVIPPLSASQQFRADAGDLMFEAAGMTLHQLVDEFERLTDVMSENTSKNKDGQYPEFVTAEPGELARRQRNLINGALRARFGLSLETWDRDLPGEGNF